MKAYHNSVVLRNDGQDPSTLRYDLNAGVTTTITVREASTPIAGLGALALIFDIAEVSIPNPLSTDSNGNYVFKVTDGIYDIVIAEGTSSESIISSVSITESAGSVISETPPAFTSEGLRWTRCTDMKVFIWYVDVDGGQWIEDRPSYGIDTIQNLTLPYEFPTVAAYKAFPTALPVGKIVNLLDRDASFTVISGTGTANTLDIIASTGISQSITLTLHAGITIEQFGAVENTDSSLAIRRSITVMGADGVTIPAKRYIYDGVVIADDVVVLRGEKMPSVNAGFTSLENGSIIEGTISFSGKSVDIRNFWADLGTGTSATDGDGIKCTAALNAGIHLHAENVGALLKNVSSPFHSTLFESYQRFTGGNISGNHGYFGCVIKCQNVNLSGVYTKNNYSDGLYLKSDTSFGRCKNVNINNIIAEGDGTQLYGMRVQADTDNLTGVNLSGYNIKGIATPILVQTLTSAITEVNITEGVINDPSTRATYIQAGTGAMNGINISSMLAVNALDTGVEFSGSMKSVSLSNVSIVYATGTTQTQWDKGVIVGSAISDTDFSGININQLYSSVNKGSIKYNNSTFLTGNILGQYNCILKGSGKPVMGASVPVDTGSTVKITPVYNSREKSSIVKAKPTANTIVTSIEFIAVGGTEVYDTGYELTVINDSAFTYTINHDVAGKIFNKAAANVIIPTNELVRYVFGGAVWHQV